MGYQEMTKEELAMAVCAATHDVTTAKARKMVDEEPESQVAVCYEKRRGESREQLVTYYKQLALHIIDGTAKRSG